LPAALIGGSIVLTFFAGGVWETVVGISYLLIPGQLLLPFAKDAGATEFLTVGKRLLMLSACWGLVDAVANSIAESLRAAGDTTFTLVVRLAATSARCSGSSSTCSCSPRSCGGGFRRANGATCSSMSRHGRGLPVDGVPSGGRRLVGQLPTAVGPCFLDGDDLIVRGRLSKPSRWCTRGHEIRGLCAEPATVWRKDRSLF